MVKIIVMACDGDFISLLLKKLLMLAISIVFPFQGIGFAIVPWPGRTGAVGMGSGSGLMTIMGRSIGFGGWF
jgi:hypothetical protein